LLDIAEHFLCTRQKCIVEPGVLTVVSINQQPNDIVYYIL